MLKHYLTIALRNLRKHPGYALINVLGLAVGLACCLLIVLFVQDEQSYDRFHDKADRTYRAVAHWTSETGVRAFARTMPAVAPALVQDVPEVEQAVRFQRFMAAMRYEDRVFQEHGVLFADPSVFDIFTFPLVQGDPETALDAPASVVLMEAAAARYFGDEDPMGQTLLLSDTLHLQVTGVAQNVPAQSHFDFDVLISFATWEARGGDVSGVWTNGTYYTYVLLAEGASPAAVESKLPGVIEARMGSQRGQESVFSLHLQPLTAIHLHSDLRHEFQPNGNAAYVTIFALVAFFILLIACINFMNLATARSMQRAREVGVRKAAGAQRAQLVTQFLTEAVVVSAVSLVVAVALVTLALPGFSTLTGKVLTVEGLEQPAYLLAAVGLALGVGLLGGSYPAFYLARFRPAAVLKGRFGVTGAATGTSRFRKALVVGQFAVSMFLIAGTTVIWNQLDHMREGQLGLEKEQILVLPFYWDALVQQRYETLKGELLRHPSVQAVTASGDVPGRIFTSMSVWGEGLPEETSKGSNALIVDPDFAETYGLAFVAGRDFSADLAADLGETFILNESAAALMGWTPEEAVGKQFRMNTMGPVIGVVRDFNYEGLQKEVEPMVMTVWPDWFGYVSLRLDAENLPATLAAIEETWQRVVPGRPFDSFFLDDDFDQQYLAEERFGQVFFVFAALAIFIACLGLFGLAVFTAERRTKEIGVRKVVGASVFSIVVLLSKDFLRLVLLAFVLAVPVIYFALQRWLQDFAYRVDLGVGPFLLTGALALGIALLTVSVQAIRAARKDPVESLRYE